MQANKGEIKMQVWMVMVNRWDGDECSSKGIDRVVSVWKSEDAANKACREADAAERANRSWDTPLFDVVGPFDVQEAAYV
jgi:hypothetical protein